MSKRKVITEPFGFIHYYAECESCDWNNGVCSETTHEEVRRSIRIHVENSGHTVVLSAGKETLYKVE